MLDPFTMSLNATYLALGVSATLTLTSTSAEPLTIRVIDKSAGVEVGDQPQVQTLRPAAAVRMYELTAKGVTQDDLEGALLEFSGGTWLIESFLPKPNPKTGEAGGELYLLIVAAGDVDG